MPDELEVGRVGRAHGLRGEVAVTFTSNRPERFEPGAVLQAAGRTLVIASSRPHQGRRLVRFDGIDDRSAAEALLGVVLTASPLGVDALDDGEHWVHELIGARVAGRDGVAIGHVIAVEANPAHDQLVLDTGALVPMVFVVDHAGDTVVVDLPDGLLEL
ncbi:MAG: ribosome maturation factor RimM [Acidimicrobiia bacterium]